jgi:hypothetical protein
MGFKDLMCFNKALLPKQCYRLFHDPDSLSTQILRAKYYPTWSILEARLGSKPSYAWRSIQSAVDLIESGLIWRIRDGVKARIWGEKWIPTPTTFMIQTQPRLMSTTTKVRELGDTDTNWWDFQRLRDNFSTEEVRAIASIPISGVGNPNVRVWRGTDSGMFLVRSAYQLAMELEQMSKPGCSRQVEESEIWRVLWQLKMPNSDKNFLWRVCHSILPTCDNLLKRKILTDSRCPFCGIEPETATYILWSCPLASNVWSVREVFFQKFNSSGAEFLQLVEEIYKKGGVEMLTVFARQSKNIWTRRNGVIHGEAFIDPNELVRITNQAMDDFSQANLSATPAMMQERVRPSSISTKPTVGSAKIKWDVGFNRATDKFGMGIVIRDADGRFVTARIVSRKGSVDPTTGEALASFSAVSFGKELGFSCIVLEGDAQVIVKGINSLERNWCKYGHIIEDIRRVLQSFQG